MSSSLTLCAKCGACAAVCPVYQVTGRESLTARGRLHLLATADSNDPALAEIFSKCLLCGACRATCPRGIDIPAIIIEARAELPEVTGFSTFKKFLARQALARPTLTATLAKTAVPLGLAPELPEESGLRFALAGQPADLSPADNQTIAPVAVPPSLTKTALYFSGCLARRLIPAIGLATESLLARLCGHRLLIPDQQGCCGLAAHSAGALKQARDLARRTIALFAGEEVRELPVLTSCASCYAGLKEYPTLLADDREWHNRALAFSKRVWELSSFLLAHRVGPGPWFSERTPAMAVVYHDPCHLRFAEITEPPRQLIREAPALHLKELPHGAQCCGMGGLFHLSHPDLATAIRTKLVDDFLAVGAKVVATSCSGCLLQWQRGLAAAKSSARATHLAVLLARQLA